MRKRTKRNHRRRVAWSLADEMMNAPSSSAKAILNELTDEELYDFVESAGVDRLFSKAQLVKAISSSLLRDEAGRDLFYTVLTDVLGEEEAVELAKMARNTR